MRSVSRANAAVREKYGRSGRALAKRGGESVNEYASAKGEVLGWVLDRAGFDVKGLDETAAMNVRLLSRCQGWLCNIRRHCQ